MHAFVDETKARGLIVAATVVRPAAVTAARKELNALRMPGQRRIHFTSESDSRRRQICSMISQLDVQVRVYDTRSISDPRAARRAALHALVGDLAQMRGQRLVIEQDDSLIQADRKNLFRSVREHQIPELVYEHVRPNTEPMLWVSDAVAWCVAKGGHWDRRVEAIVETTIVL